jgi:hypothetical protein
MPQISLDMKHTQFSHKKIRQATQARDYRELRRLQRMAYRATGWIHLSLKATPSRNPKKAALVESKSKWLLGEKTAPVDALVKLADIILRLEYAMTGDSDPLMPEMRVEREYIDLTASDIALVKDYLRLTQQPTAG